VLGSPFGFPMWQLQGDQSGQFLIGTTASVAGDAHLYVFSVAGVGSAAPGAISPVVGSPFPTANTPTAVEVQPGGTGNLVYSISVSPFGGENPIEGYQLNPSTGALTIISGSPFGFFSTDGVFDQSGTYFFTYDGSSSTVSVFDVTKNSALSQAIASEPSFTEPFAVTDPP